jgi:hypothetical protein
LLAQSRESKKAVMNDSLNGCQNRDDQRASSEATDSRPGHHQENRTFKVRFFLFHTSIHGRPLHNHEVIASSKDIFYKYIKGLSQMQK